MTSKHIKFVPILTKKLKKQIKMKHFNKVPNAIIAKMIFLLRQKRLFGQIVFPQSNYIPGLGSSILATFYFKSHFLLACSPNNPILTMQWNSNSLKSFIIMPYDTLL
jgi:hypothetical protein